LTAQIKALRAAGGDVIVSFGGAANVPLHVAAPDAESLKEQYKRFIKAYGLTRIDFDIEGNWVEDTVSLIRNSKALKMLQDELAGEGYSLQIWFTLPVLPSGLTASGMNVIRLALAEGVEIDGVNVMTMDYGDSAAPAPSGRMGEYGIQALESLHSQLTTLYGEAGISKSVAELWRMTGTTPMIGLNDVRTEVFYHEDAMQTLDFAVAKGIGMISMWSANRDRAQNTDSLTFVSISSTGLAQDEYGFSSIFNEYNDLSGFSPDAAGSEEPGEDNGSETGNTWSADTVYYGSDYESIWNDPWEYIGEADGAAADPGDATGGQDDNTGDNAGSGSGTWEAGKTYVGGDLVTWNNVTYKAKWWNQNFRPDTPVENSWDSPWAVAD
jgi:chitinase